MGSVCLRTGKICVAFGGSPGKRFSHPFPRLVLGPLLAHFRSGVDELNHFACGVADRCGLLLVRRSPCTWYSERFGPCDRDAHPSFARALVETGLLFRSHFTNGVGRKEPRPVL